MIIKSLENIQAIISQAEGNNVEFKLSTGQLDRAMETLCAFLNGTSGTVLFGVDDYGNVVGQEVSDKTKRDIAEALKRFEPITTVHISYIPIGDNKKFIISVHVEEAQFERPYSYANRAYIRIESVTTVMPMQRYKELLLQQNGDYDAWESYSDDNLEISDLDEEKILRTVRLGMENGRLPETAEKNVTLLLEKLGLVDNGKLKRATAVLFAKKRLFSYPQCLLRLARFRGTDKSVFIDSQQIYGNIFQQIDAAMAFFFKHLSLSGTTETLVREEHLTVPYKALRESAVNALCHRSFRDVSASASIAIYDDRIEIENPGRLPSGWDIEKLVGSHDSRPQNRLIADILYIRRLLENWGRGVSLIMEECERAGLPKPEYEVASDSIKIIFKYGDTTISPVNIDLTSRKKVTDQVTDQVKRIILAIGYQELSAADVMNIIGLVHRPTFRNDYLHPAIQENFITQSYPDQPNHPRQKYRLTEKGKELLEQMKKE